MKEKTKGWLEYAKRDLTAAKELLENEFVANVVCYLSQQASEKAIKAILEECDLEVPKVHDLVFLYKFVKKNTDIKLGLNESELRKLSSIYVNARYPGELGLLPSGFPTREDAKYFCNFAESIVAEVLKAMENIK